MSLVFLELVHQPAIYIKTYNNLYSASIKTIPKNNPKPAQNFARCVELGSIQKPNIAPLPVAKMIIRILAPIGDAPIAMNILEIGVRIPSIDLYSPSSSFFEQFFYFDPFTDI